MLDTEKLSEKAKTLKSKARAARKEGKKVVSKAFRKGARRASRKLRALQAQLARAAKPKSED